MKLKQAIIVRIDLGMGKGKIAGQAHAAVQAAESIRMLMNENILIKYLAKGELRNLSSRSFLKFIFVI
jgi:peptidyl-tRNA hydrolase